MTSTAHPKPAASHAPEPWHYEMDYSVTTIFAPDLTGHNPDGAYVAEIDGQDVGRFATREQHEANARRIVAAVNACQGIPTDALEQGVVAGMRAELKWLVEAVFSTGISEAEAHRITMSARAALARATAA